LAIFGDPVRIYQSVILTEPNRRDSWHLDQSSRVTSVYSCDQRMTNRTGSCVDGKKIESPHSSTWSIQGQGEPARQTLSEFKSYCGTRRQTNAHDRFLYLDH